MSSPANIYELRKVEGLCTYSTGCQRPLADGSQLCERHLRKQRKRQREQKAAQRAANRAAGRCAMCGKKTDGFRCLACATKRKAHRTTGVSDGVAAYEQRQARVSGRTFLESDGRTRFRGQPRRGRQSIQSLDAKDSELGKIDWAKYDAAIAYARRPEADEVPRIQREEAVKAANNFLRQAGGQINEILVRNGELPLTHVADDEDEDDGA